MKIEPLNGDYCRYCVESFTKHPPQKGIIYALCQKDLRQFLRNGDFEIVQKMVTDAIALPE